MPFSVLRLSEQTNAERLLNPSSQELVLSFPAERPAELREKRRWLNEYHRSRATPAAGTAWPRALIWRYFSPCELYQACGHQLEKK